MRSLAARFGAALVVVITLHTASARADFPGADWEGFVGTLGLAGEWSRPAPLGLDATFAYERFYGQDALFLFSAGYRVDVGLDTIRGEPHAAIDGLLSIAGRLTVRGGVGGRFGPLWPYAGVLRLGGPDVHGAIDLTVPFDDTFDAEGKVRLSACAGVVFDVERGEPIGYAVFSVGFSWMQPMGREASGSADVGP